MKKILLTLVLIGVLLLAGVGIDLANAQLPAGAPTAPDWKFDKLIETVINTLFYILITIAAILILVGAFHFLTSAGDPEKVATARNYVIYALIAIIVGAAAKGLATFITDIFKTAK